MGRYRVGLETRARILDAARQVLAEEGLEGTTLKAVCGRAGVGAGSFYNLFDSKEEMVLEVVGEAIGAVDAEPGEDTVAGLVRTYVRFVTEAPVPARIYLQLAVCGALTDPVLAHRVLGHHDRRVSRMTSALLREGQAADASEAGRQAEMLLATLNGLALHRLLDPDLDMAGYAEALLREHTRR